MFRAKSIKRLVFRTLAGKWVLLPLGAAALSMPAVAKADFRGDRGRDNHWERRHYGHGHGYGYGRPRGGTNIDVDIRIGSRPAPRPEYCERVVKVWVPPVYKTVVDRKWVEAVYRTECERVWVPPVYEDREVHFIGERGRPRVRIERVLVRDGCFQNRERRVCVSEGHWETCERQVLVCEGHYETRVERERIPRWDLLNGVNPGLAGA